MTPISLYGGTFTDLSTFVRILTRHSFISTRNFSTFRRSNACKASEWKKKRLPISSLPWSAHGAAGTCFPGEHFHCGNGVPCWHQKCWRACCFHQHGSRKAVSRCGLRVEEKFTPVFPGERGPLFTASVKLLQFALRASSASAREKGLMRKKKLYYRPFGPWWRILTGIFWQCLPCWFSPSWKDRVGSVHLGRTNGLSHQWSLWGWENPRSCCHNCWLNGDGPNLKGHGRNQRECSSACLC